MLQQFFLAFLFCFLASSACAAPDDRAIRAMLASHTGWDEPQIRTEIAKGCDGSGDMAICAWYQYFQEDVKLNDAYGELVGRLQERSVKDDLRSAQRAWIEYRDARCRFETSGWEGGSFRTVAIASCWKSMTKARSKELLEVLTCEGPDCLALGDAKPKGRRR